MSFSQIPIYVITTKQFHSRHLHMGLIERRLNASFEYILDFDSEDITSGDLNAIDASMPLSSCSCLLKHFEAQRRFLATDQEYCLVLEDDVVLFDDFENGFKKAIEAASTIEPGWLIFFGGADNKIDQRFLHAKENDLILRELSTAECYLLDRKSCELRSRWLESNNFSKPADHQIVLMDRELSIKHYWTSRPFATQGSITGRFPTSLDRSRKKHSRTFLSTKYYWNRFRRQIIPRLATIFRKK